MLLGRFLHLAQFVQQRLGVAVRLGRTLDDHAPRRLERDARGRPVGAQQFLVERVARVLLIDDGREAAQALGIHRHTVRARVAQAQQVLGLDLASFPARAELWAALVTTS